MKNLIKILIANILIFNGAAECFALTNLQQIIRTNVPPAVNITALNPAAAQGTINPQTGNSSSPSASFQLQTNGLDEKYTYVVQATLQTTGNVLVNAYTQIASQEYIMLGNNASPLYPTTASVNNITGGSPVAANNPNVIAYPISNTINNLASMTLTNNATYGGYCYIVKTGTSKKGTITQTLGAAPLSGTYLVGNDRAGVYQALVRFTSNRNP